LVLKTDFCLLTTVEPKKESTQIIGVRAECLRPIYSAWPVDSGGEGTVKEVAARQIGGGKNLW
jgi:hypothetical protein